MHVLAAMQLNHVNRWPERLFDDGRTDDGNSNQRAKEKLTKMNRMRIIGLALVAVFAMSAVAAASASAFTEFVAKPEGGKFPVTLTDENPAGNNHVFTTNGKEVVCKKEKSTGTIEKEKSATNVEEVTYTECHVKAIFEFAAEVSKAKYEFNAKGSVSVLNTITIKVPVAGCEVKVSNENAKKEKVNQNLKTVTYKNSEPVKTLEVKAAVEKITWTGTGGECGKEGAEGKYTGNSVAKLPGTGTIEVK